MARILVIDDDETILSLEKKILSDQGYEVFSTNSGLTALDILKLHEMDLIIADIQMPRFDGLQFVRTLKMDPKLRATSVAFLTSSREADVVAKAAKLEPNFYLVKPIDKKQFVERIASFFATKPPKEHARIEFQNPAPFTVKVHHQVRLISISDICVEVLVAQDWEEDQIVELPSASFNEIFAEDPCLKVLSIQPHEGNYRRARLIFLDSNLEKVRKIQKLIQVKSQDPALFKYPRSR